MTLSTPKIKKKLLMDMLECINAVKTSATQRMNAFVEQ